MKKNIKNVESMNNIKIKKENTEKNLQQKAAISAEKSLESFTAVDSSELERLAKNGEQKQTKTAENVKDVFALISTVTGVLLVNLNTKRVFPLKTEYVEYFGISWFPQGKELVLSNNMIQATEPIADPLLNLILSERGILSVGEKKLPPFLSDPHQILCTADDKIICTNTGRNSLSVLDVNRPHLVQDIKIFDERWDSIPLNGFMKKGHHLNSLFQKDDKLYVIAHGNEKGSSLVTLSYPDFDILSIEFLGGNRYLHNIWVTSEEQRISCLSEKGGLIELGKNTTSILWEASTPIFTRGLAASSDFVLIGESQISGGKERGVSVSGLWLVDRKTWKTLDYFYLGPYGAIHDVRLVNISDEAHHGYIFQNLEKLLEQSLFNTVVQEKLQISKRMPENIELNLGDIIHFSHQYKNFSSYSKVTANNVDSLISYCLRAGWDNIEPWGIWTNKKEALLRIPVNKLPRQFQLKLVGHAFITPFYKQQFYEFWVLNGRLIDKVSTQYNDHTITHTQAIFLSLDKEQDSINDEIFIKIKLHNPISPKEVSGGNDERMLGFGLMSMEFLPSVSV